MKVSVIIPVFNDEKYLAQCLNSVINQTEKELEIICIDDCSTDRSIEILNQYLKKDSRIKVVRLKRNKGSGTARNIGIKLSKSEFICFCDADDVYPPNAIKSLLKAITLYKVDISCGNILLMDNNLRFVCTNKIQSMTQIHYLQKTNIDNPSLWLPYYHTRFLFKRNFIIENKILYPNLKRCQDPPMIAKALSLAKNVAIIPDVVYIYRTSARPSKFFYQNLENFMLHMHMVINYFNSNNYYLQSAFYTYFCLQQVLNFKIILKLDRKKIHKIIEVFDKAINFLIYKYNFEPNMDKTEIIKYFTLLKKGKYLFLFYKLYKKTIGNFCKGRA